MASPLDVRQGNSDNAPVTYPILYHHSQTSGLKNAHGTVDSDTCKTQKNQLFQEKQKLKTRYPKQKKSVVGSKFVNCSIPAQKIARKGSVGLRTAVVEWEKPNRCLHTWAGARAIYPRGDEKSQMVVCYNNIRTWFQQNY